MDLILQDFTCPECGAECRLYCERADVYVPPLDGLTHCGPEEGIKPLGIPKCLDVKLCDGTWVEYRRYES